MLVLTRKTNEKIVIGPDIIVTVVAIQGDKIRIGIEAPRELIVDRLEVSAKRAASESARTNLAGGLGSARVPDTHDRRHRNRKGA